jgi:hypothetical protein
VDTLPDILRHVQPGEVQIPPEQWDALVDAATRGNLGAGGYADATGTVYRRPGCDPGHPWQFAMLTTPLAAANSTAVTGATPKGWAYAYGLTHNANVAGWVPDPSTIDNFGNDLLTVYAPPMLAVTDLIPAGYCVKIEWLADPVQPGWYVTAAQCAMAAAQ